MSGVGWLPLQIILQYWARPHDVTRNDKLSSVFMQQYVRLDLLIQ